MNLNIRCFHFPFHARLNGASDALLKGVREAKVVINRPRKSWVVRERESTATLKFNAIAKLKAKNSSDDRISTPARLRDLGISTIKNHHATRIHSSGS